MGCGASTPATKDAAVSAAAAKPAAPDVPDVGLSARFDAVKFLGRGGTGDTWLYKRAVELEGRGGNKETGELVAVKLIKRPLPKIILPNILREIQIQADLGEGHVNVIEAKEALLTESHLALVMEYAAGGSLTGYVAERWQHAQANGLFLSEAEARYFFRQFIEAVSYCHANCVAHRDLKLDNTLLDGGSPPIIKLCDFGFAKTWTEDANMFTHIGTPVYMSPELINSNRASDKGYDGALADVWASGILLIVMLLGTFPFDHVEHPDPNTSEAHLEVWLQQVRQPWSGMPHIKHAVEKLTPECMDLMNRIFIIDEKKRISIAEIKAHPWYKRPLAAKHEAAEADVAARQAAVEAANRTKVLNPRLVAARTENLERLVNQASTRAPTGAAPLTSPLVRIDLTEAAVLDVDAARAGGGAPAAGVGPGAETVGAGGASDAGPSGGDRRGSAELVEIAEGDEEGSMHGGGAAAAAGAAAKALASA